MRQFLIRTSTALMLVLTPAMGAHADDDSRPLFPNEEELRALGDMANEMMRNFADRMEPMAERLKALVDDLDAYEAPEMLPNGDIIMRRRPDAPPPAATEDEGIAL